MAKGNWRDTLDRKLLNVLKRDGVKAFLELATSMLSVDAERDYQLKAQFVGEVCECVLWGLTKKYLAATGHEAQIYHSVVLKDLRDVKSDFRTELDFVVVSPSFILTTECKSYSGAVTISKECTLQNSSHSVDVWRQSKLHYDKLVLYGRQLVTPGIALPSPPVFANVFLFSNSEVRDTRANKGALRVVTTSSLFDFYDAIFKKYSKPVYNYERACKIFKLCSASKKLHAQHGEYVGYTD